MNGFDCYWMEVTQEVRAEEERVIQTDCTTERRPRHNCPHALGYNKDKDILTLGEIRDSFDISIDSSDLRELSRSRQFEILLNGMEIIRLYIYIILIIYDSANVNSWHFSIPIHNFTN
jgi:hypothetical protein